MLDPYAREIDSALGAIKNRVPGARESLYAKRDVFGQPTENRERLGAISPVTVSRESGDRVRTEAARLGVGVAKTPDEIILPAGRDRKLGTVELTPGQRDVFSEVTGRTAHGVLEPLVNSMTWDALPDMTKRLIYDEAFRRARAVGRAAALPPEQREIEARRIVEEMSRRLAH